MCLFYTVGHFGRRAISKCHNEKLNRAHLPQCHNSEILVSDKNYHYLSKKKSIMAVERYYGGQLQTFEALRTDNRVYVDKTEYIYKMTHKYDRVFLSRPRRFGKSLLCSTLRSYFEGRKELFKGLAIEKLEKDWIKYPVLLFDMSTGKHKDKDTLERHLGRKLAEYEKKYNITSDTTDNNDRLITLIETAYAQENKKVVIIIDEYDAPLLDVVHEEQNLPPIRHVMRNFYSPLKACDQYIHFVFLTGITKFSQLSIFSELNNIVNISMKREFAAICGISEEELLTQLSVDIDNMAEVNGETRETTIKELKKMYDGYHFCWPSPDIYNPYSLINSFTDGERFPYWLESGATAFIVEMLRKFNIQPHDIGKRKVSAVSFDAPTESMENITPLLYQSGYLTIKGYDKESDLYELDLPNEEVRKGLMQGLLPNYVSNDEEAYSTVGEIRALIRRDDMEGALTKLQKFLLKVPYADFIKKERGEDIEEAKTKKFTEYEGYYKQLLFVIFSMLGGTRVATEVDMATGSIDMSLETKTRIYVIEIKTNKSAWVALNQIDKRNYVAKYSDEPLPVYKLGINFDTEARTINEWIVEPVD